MKAAPTLICIPDISGFTQFMSDMDFELTSRVIPSLLNNIIYSNEIELKVSEIEGDAVLFFRQGELPPLDKLVEQCRYFYTEFYKQMNTLRKKHSDKNGAYKIPEMLGLKIILHYGQEIGVVPVGKRIKLMGEDVIVAHRLLKNNVPIDEYILISDQLISEYDSISNDDFDWASLKESSIKIKHMGDVGFKYINLKPLTE
ncbi:DUF2652 domain-containing protein [Aggregatimonas sangjinii]|uniref:DUF2652 domain-containing protein n=1 Tax=Aggregatimonas sangjinii TaxID=2583587 RepID=A0A5B7SJJ1_9FLAO|nr:DUF2652 domain-containing protein [Aggregatimonas sangjinii]QCW98624.1 DUF2652 domain-containing protein [Aggregatimonas sangjinii]